MVAEARVDPVSTVAGTLACVVFSHRAHWVCLSRPAYATRRERPHSWNPVEKHEDTASFVVPPEAIHPGEVNRISLDTEKAGPVGADPREIGFGFVSLDLRAAAPDESCVIDPAAQPDYNSISVDWAPSCYGLEGNSTAPMAMVRSRQPGGHPQFFLQSQTLDAERRPFHRSRKELRRSRFDLGIFRRYGGRQQPSPGLHPDIYGAAGRPYGCLYLPCPQVGCGKKPQKPGPPF